MTGLSPRSTILREVHRVSTPLLLANPAASPLLATGLSIARAGGAPLAAYCIEEPGAELPDRLQQLIQGHAGSEADRAVHNLVGSAFRGTQIPLRSFVPEEHGSAPSSKAARIIGWLKGQQRPSLPAARAFAGDPDGSLLLLTEGGAQAFEEVLVVTWKSGSKDEAACLEMWAAALEHSYPVWRLHADKPAALQRARRDLGPRSLLVLSPAPGRSEEVENLEQLSPGPTCLLLAPGTPRAPVLSLLFSA